MSLSIIKHVSKALLLLVLITPLITGCATSKKLQPVQLGDNKLSKEQLMNEIHKLDLAQKEIDSKKGMTGTNVASALFWLPGLMYTYYDAGEATRLIAERRSHLTGLYNQKYANAEESTKILDKAARS
jgi:hypothetical protein